jgi:argininosuccinate lyase
MAFQEVLAQRAREAGDVYLPGYTHMQRAQPVLLAHHLLAHGWALARDVDRLVTTVDRLNTSPLGAGALAGSSLPLDPDYVAAELGFHGRFENSLDAVSDRDFVAESLFDLALLGVHLSRMGEEIVLWSTEEFGFCTLDDAYATGSSMLPQKKNPDVAELARGKTGRLLGHLTAVLVTLKGLPLAYNRDLQEDKEPLFDSVRQVSLALAALRGVYETATWNEDRMRAAADGPAASAIDLAEMLVEQGMAFRQAHALVGGIVRESLERHVPLVELVAAHPDLGESAVELLEPGVAVTRRRTPGGAGPGPVAEQSERFARRLEVDRTRLAQWRPADSGPGSSSSSSSSSS